jgi:alginate O-acetyltransferase complex protein AlgJ
LKIIKNITPFAFLLFISLHLVLFFTLKKEPIDFVQNREKLLVPSYDTSGINGYIDSWTDYIEDHFPLKMEYIKQSNLIKGLCFNSFNVKNKVIIGKNNLLFYNASIYDELGLNEFSGFDLWEIKKLSKVVENIKTIKKWCNKNKIHFEVMICPNKQTIYPEYLPQIYSSKHDSRIKQLTRVLPEMMNLESILKKSKKENPKQLLYYKTDTHWNAYGALMACQELRKRLSFSFPYIDDLSFSIKDSISSTGFDLANMMSLKDNYSDVVPLITFKNKYPKKIPKLLIMHDSFSESLSGPLNQLFTTITFRHLYLDGMPSPKFLLESKTDVFIIELVERYKELLTSDIDSDFYK